MLQPQGSRWASTSAVKKTDTTRSGSGSGAGVIGRVAGEAPARGLGCGSGGFCGGLVGGSEQAPRRMPAKSTQGIVLSRILVIVSLCALVKVDKANAAVKACEDALDRSRISS